MRSSACDTVPRYCARPVLCCLTFPSAPALGSASSAAGCPALFVGFTATMAESEALTGERIGQRDPTDRPSSTHRLVPPPLDQSQQCRRIRLQFLQRLALDARNSSAHQPARLAHLDDHYQGRDRIKRGRMVRLSCEYSLKRASSFCRNSGRTSCLSFSISQSSYSVSSFCCSSFTDATRLTNT